VETTEGKYNFDPHSRGERRLDAYYYCFEETGVEVIDNILAAVAAAGKAFHHTDQWADPLWDNGEAPVDAIQRMANVAAAHVTEDVIDD